MSAPLPLDSPVWANLQHAYGSAEDIPDILQDLELADEIPDAYDAEPMFTLWSSLYHQDDVYSASYAAFPHLIRIAKLKHVNDRSRILQLAAAIAAAWDDPEPFLTPATSSAYTNAIPEALALYVGAFVEKENITGRELIFSLGGMAAFKGKAAIARLMFSFDSFIDCYNSQSFDFRLEEQVVQQVLNDE